MFKADNFDYDNDNDNNGAKGIPPLTCLTQ